MSYNKTYKVTLTHKNRPGQQVVIENCLNAPQARERAVAMYGGTAHGANQVY